MKSMILALSLLAPLAPSPLAERPAGSLRELRVVENDGRTEIVVRVAGEPRYRLFRRLSDPVDPRLTLEVLDAEAAALAARYPNVRRGGVRELRLTPTDSGTVQLAIGLAAAGPRAFGVVKRDGAIVVWMRNQDGPFAPWSSGGGAAVEASTAKAAPATAPSQEVSPRAEHVTAVSAPAPVASTEGGVEVDAGGLDVAPAALEADASDAATTVGIVARVRALAGRAADAIRQAGPAAIDVGIVALLALAILPVLRMTRSAVLTPAAATPAPSGTAARAGGLPQTARRPARPKREWRLTTRKHRAAAPSSPDTRLWTVHTLAAQGRSHAEIARSTGLSRDAVALIVRSAAARGHGGQGGHGRHGGPVVATRAPRPDAEGSAGSGTFFRPAAHPGRVAAAGGGYWKVVL